MIDIFSIVTEKSDLKLFKKDPRGNYVILVNTITASYGIFYSVLFFYYKATFALICMIFGVVFVAPLVRYFWTRGYLTAAKLLCIGLTNFYIFTASFGLNHQVGAEYFYLASIMLPLLLFEAQEKRNIVLGFSFAVFCALLHFLGSSSILSSDLMPENFPYERFRILSYWAAFFASAVFVVVYNILMKRLQEHAVDIERSSRMQLIHSAKMSSLGEMAGGIAHEINNPLTIIIGRVDLMQRQLANGTHAPNSLGTELGKIDETARRIAKIISGLRAFSRDSDGDEMERTNMSVILDDVLSLCQEKLRVSFIELRRVKNVDFEINCRPYQVAQILMNLILNSVDAVSTLNEKWVEIAASCDQNKARITVVDSGSGIPEDIVEKIMQPFFTTKSIGKGTGLGLSISKGLAEEHGGSLEYVTSTNTTFVLTLPLRQ